MYEDPVDDVIVKLQAIEAECGSLPASVGAACDSLVAAVVAACDSIRSTTDAACSSVLASAAELVVDVEQFRSFSLGDTEPTLANTGPRVAPTETVTGATVKVTTPTTFTGKRFETLLSIEAPTTFVDCEIVGPLSYSPTAVRPLIQATNINASVAFEHCLIRPHKPDPAVAGVMGHKIRSDRSVWAHGVDGIGYNPKSTTDSYLTVRGSWIGDLAYFTPDPYQSDNKSHTDCIQVHGDAVNIELVGNTLAGFNDPTVGQGASAATSTSAVMFSPKGSVMRDVLIDRNWIDGGSASLNFGSWEACTNTAVTNNRFGSGQRDGWRIIKKDALAVTITGNTPNDDWKRG